MTYLEMLRQKGGQARLKLSKKLARFKLSSERGQEAQNDLIVYMSDYMSDLIAQGMSEQQAFDKAKAELAAPGDSDIHAELQERFRQYYENLNPADYEAVGLLYGGFLFLGLAVGSVTGFIASGGVPTFLKDGWIYTLVGAGTGTVIGLGLGLIGNAIVFATKRN